MVQAWRYVVVLATLLLPWPVRRLLLRALLGYRLDSSSRIGLSLIAPEQLVMEPHSRIGHLTVCRGPRFVSLGESAEIGRLNWITAHPLSDKTMFAAQPDRDPALVIERHAVITHRHLIDCTDRVTIGAFSTVAGWRSQLLAHSIDLASGNQFSKPISIGTYCFLGTACIVIGGAGLADHCILGANSLLHRNQEQDWTLYSGVPARAIRAIDQDSQYFLRTSGHVS